MKLLTTTVRQRLIRNGEISAEHAENGKSAPDFLPVVKLFTPDAACTWLLTELDPDDQDLAFGLCDLGLGYPEFGNVRLSEIASLRGNLGLPVEHDLDFRAAMTIAEYATHAHMNGHITA